MLIIIHYTIMALEYLPLSPAAGWTLVYPLKGIFPGSSYVSRQTWLSGIQIPITPFWELQGYQVYQHIFRYKALETMSWAHSILE